MAAESTGQDTLRAENVERMVTGLALARYAAKNAVMTSSSSSWTESYYQETSTPLTAGTTASIKGIPRLAKFPYAEPTWTKQSAYIEKYGLEGVVSYEDARTDAFDIISRSLIRIAEGVVKAIDDEILSVLSEVWDATPTNINSVAIAAGYEWDSSTIANRDPIQNILNALAEIKKQNYTPNGNALLYLSPTDAANLLGNSNIRNAGQFYTADVTKNGQIGGLLGVTIVETNSVPADFALMLIPKICGTWKAVTPLTVLTIYDEGIKYTIRAFEMGVTQLTNPKAVCIISNTQA